MFTWICPKCGGEVPPSFNECPRCSGKTAASPAPAPVKGSAPAEPVAATPPSPASTILPPPPAEQSRPMAPPPASPVMAPPAPAAVAVHRAISPALVATLAGLAIVVLLAVLYLWVLPRSRAQQTAATAAPEAATPAGGGHPLAKHLELTGVRITEHTSGSAKIQFLVINHSAADLPEFQMTVRLRAADRELFSFPIDLPSMGPYEFRELSTQVKTELKPYELPDWQQVRAAFTLAAKP